MASIVLIVCDGCEEPVVSGGDLVSQGTVGPRVRWDPGATPLPDLPLPNDVACFPDPTSPTGLRLNVSTDAPTAFERSLRAQFNEMDGWGTFMPITVGFDDDIDLGALLARHQHDEFDFRDDAVYVVNLDTGVPVPLDIGSGSDPLTVANTQGWFVNDPRAGESNLLLSTVNEDTNADGILQPSEDSNFDGVMQRAAIFPSGARPEDALTSFWEPDTSRGSSAHGGTLILRPLVPLAERTRYAVILTDRLRGIDGPVRSPFDGIAHPSQLAALQAMQRHLQDPNLSSRFFGNLAWNPPPDQPAPHGRVTFAWTFTTQTTVSDLFDLHDGLYGLGRYAGISQVTPDFTVFPSHGGVSCTPDQTAHPFTVSRDEIQSILRMLLPTLGFQGPQADALVASYDWVDYLYIAQIHTPYLSGNPHSTQPDDHWHLEIAATDPQALGTDDVQLWVYVPRARADAPAPFPVVFNAHGYGAGAIQSIAFAGYFARLGLATVAANAPTHGFPLPTAAQSAVRTILGGECLMPFASAVVAGRSRDLNGDGNPDSGGDFLSAHVFHTRDLVRQTALDYMQIVRALTDPSFAQDGGVDYNRDGHIDALGDLNGDGTVDIAQGGGGPLPFYMWGESLGGITSMVLGGLDPAIRAVAPVSGGAGLIDVGLRSTVEGVGGAVLAPLLGPIIVALPASERGPVNGRTRTACPADQMSIRWVTQDVNSIGELEISCTPLGGPQGSIAPGDDVVAYDFANGLERCARVPGDGRLFLPVAADAGDQIALTVFRGNAITDYGTCARSNTAASRSQILTYSVGEGSCDQTCGHVPPNATPDTPAAMNGRHRGDLLTAPSSGLGLKRQTPAFRRFIQLAQAAIDPGDPVNYAPLFFLQPRPATSTHPILAMTTIGDTDVPIATGNTFARAAGLLPFIQSPTGSALDEYVAPSAIWNRYHRTPDGVLVDNYVIEGLSRLARHPVPLGADYLFDPDDLDDGRQPFGEATLAPPLRLVRSASPVRSIDSPLVDLGVAAQQIAHTWQPSSGPFASFINAYIVPTGVHTFMPSDPSQPWDSGAYFGNLVAQFFHSSGNDVVFYTNPSGHQCLENSSCAFIPQTP